MVKDNTPIQIISDNKDIVDCIGTNTYDNLPEILINEFSKYDNSFINFLKVFSIPLIFNKVEEIILSENNPIELFKSFLNDYLIFIKDIKNEKFPQYFNLVYWNGNNNLESESEVKMETGSHYGKLFKEFNINQFLEAKSLLEVRFKRNNFDLNIIKDKRVLDQGCGGGRYTVALKLLGAGDCIGVDYSDDGIADANYKVNSLNLEGVKFIKNDVLNLEFEDNSFDFVFSNGVLHHTTDWQKGVSELMRVLKPGGYGFLYLIENPGGLFWDSIEILRAINKNTNKKFARDVMKSLNYPNNKIFYMLDHVLAPINTRLTVNEIENELKKNGADKIIRWNRGVDFDRVEKLYQNLPFGKEKFGVGENRFIFNKI